MRIVSSQSWYQSTTGNFSGPVWISRLSEPSEPEGITVLGVHFAPGSRTDWHSHTEGQILHVIEGHGHVVTGDGKRVSIKTGDTITAAPGELHWHGSAKDSPMTHLSITSGGGATWSGRKVTDSEYA